MDRYFEYPQYYYLFLNLLNNFLLSIINFKVLYKSIENFIQLFYISHMIN